MIIMEDLKKHEKVLGKVVKTENFGYGKVVKITVDWGGYEILYGIEFDKPSDALHDLNCDSERIFIGEKLLERRNGWFLVSYTVKFVNNDKKGEPHGFRHYVPQD